MMQVARLARFEVTVADLARSIHFYTDGLGFIAVNGGETTAYGARIHQAVLRRGAQTLLLQQFAQPGAPYPADTLACDQVFQHFALPVPEIAAAFQRLSHFQPLPIGGPEPQRLPERSGGATAWKFRDPDGHPLELIQFPDGHGDGIDHSAIVSTDAARSIAFYCERLGLRLAAAQTNYGCQQDRLDGLTGTRVDVVALEPLQPSPHLELLAYDHPAPRPMLALQPADIAATRLVLAGSGKADAGLQRDPDGHLLILEPDTGA